MIANESIRLRFWTHTSPRHRRIGGLLVAVVGLTLPVLLVYFLYQGKIFIRL